MTDLPPVDRAPAVCGAVNPTLGLRCNREPHLPGTAHYHDNRRHIRSWAPEHPVTAGGSTL